MHSKPAYKVHKEITLAGASLMQAIWQQLLAFDRTYLYRTFLHLESDSHSQVQTTCDLTTIRYGRHCQNDKLFMGFAMHALLQVFMQAPLAGVQVQGRICG